VTPDADAMQKRRPGFLLAILPPGQGERKAVTASGSKGRWSTGLQASRPPNIWIPHSTMQNSPYARPYRNTRPMRPTRRSAVPRAFSLNSSITQRDTASRHGPVPTVDSMRRGWPGIAVGQAARRCHERVAWAGL